MGSLRKCRCLFQGSVIEEESLQSLDSEKGRGPLCVNKFLGQPIKFYSLSVILSRKFYCDVC